MRRRGLLAVLVLCVVTRPVHAQELSFPDVGTDPAAVAKVMPDLAKQVLASYKDTDRENYLDNLFRLQIVQGQYKEAIGTIGSLREVLRTGTPPRGAWVNAQYEVHARAKFLERGDNGGFEEAYRRAFRDAFAHMDDRTSALVVRALTTIDPADEQQAFQSDLQKQKGKNTISTDDALNLVRDYQVAEAYGAASLNKKLFAEDDSRRYLTEKDIQVKTSDGATVCALVMRPRAVTARLTTLLIFTIYVDLNDNMSDARMTASNGYAGVIGFTRGKACSPDKPVPYVHDGADAAT